MELVVTHEADIMPIRAIVFDAVGTLIHPQPSAPDVYAQTAAAHGVTLTAHEIRQRFLAAYRAEESRDRAANWATSESREVERWRTIVAESLPGADAEACFRHLYAHYAQPHAWRVDVDAAHVFAMLRERGIRLGLASNYDSRLESVIAGHAELRSLDPTVVISSQIGVRKPSPCFFASVAQRLAMAQDAILYVGDDVDNDFHGATNAGLHAVLLDPHDRHPTLAPRIRSLLELVECDASTSDANRLA
jgi:putative hydrolase of the HAD superfamily